MCARTNARCFGGSILRRWLASVREITTLSDKGDLVTGIAMYSRLLCGVRRELEAIVCS